MFAMIWITHLKNIHRSIAADHVDESASGIEIHISRITHDRQFGDDLSGICIENHQPSRQTAADEKSSDKQALSENIYGEMIDTPLDTRQRDLLFQVKRRRILRIH